MLPLNSRGFSQPEGVIRLLEFAAGRKGRLWIAVTYRDAKRVHRLLRKGHDPLYVHEESGLTLFRQAALRGDTDILDVLAEAGAWDAELAANQGNAAVRAALVRNNKQAVQWMVQRGADVDRVDELGRNVLMKAIELDKSAVATWLVRRTRDLSTTDGAGDTALHLACRGDKVSVARALLKAGADAEARNENGDQPGDLCESHKLRALFAG